MAFVFFNFTCLATVIIGSAVIIMATEPIKVVKVIEVVAEPINLVAELINFMAKLIKHLAELINLAPKKVI